MSQLSNAIEKFIIERLKEDGATELQRNKLALEFGCAPSQINYVLSTRFTVKQGYTIESRRGGGGYIRVLRISDDGLDLVGIVERAVGERLNQQDGFRILQRLYENEVLDPLPCRVMAAALSEESLRMIESDRRDIQRAILFKAMILAVAKER